MNVANTPIHSALTTFDDIGAVVLIADATGYILYANRAVKTLLGYDQKEVLGAGWWELTANSVHEIKHRRQYVVDLLSGKGEVETRNLYENCIRSKEGKKVWAQWTNHITKDGLLVGIAQDITERKKLELELHRKNAENELLLKEIHHRVKNNLQIISSLLNLQFRTISDKEVIEALQKSKDRINAMALIHTKLYESSLTSIDFQDYINQLVDSISHSHTLDDRILWIVDCEGIEFDIDLSIRLGLIVNELTTNAFKHAFIGGEEGKLMISIKELEDGRYYMRVKDDGIGFGPEFSIDNSGSLGLEIVSALVEQIDGTLKVNSNKGACFGITFETN